VSSLGVQLGQIFEIYDHSTVYVLRRYIRRDPHRLFCVHLDVYMRRAPSALFSTFSHHDMLTPSGQLRSLHPSTLQWTCVDHPEHAYILRIMKAP
jgi:hypothetical protein